MPAPPSTETLEAIKKNLFSASHAAIGDWNSFRWHRIKGAIQTHKPWSSQALAIDVFGTIKVSDERDLILGALARECGLPDAGPWKLELECVDHGALLGEKTSTQVDAIAFGQGAALIIECKFKEGGGRCSQTRLRTERDGSHIGLRQCNGNYEMQRNPVTDTQARCALAGKNIKYWDFIPTIFDLHEQDYRPCPFSGSAYQWMRNILLADRLSTGLAVPAAVIAAYAAGPFATAKKVQSGLLGPSLGSKIPLVPISYQSIVTRAQSLSSRSACWSQLAVWVQDKIDAAAAEQRPAPSARRSAKRRAKPSPRP